MGTSQSYIEGDLNHTLFSGLFQWNPPEDQLSRLVLYALGEEVKDESIEQRIQKLRSLPAVMLRAKAMEMMLRLNLIAGDLTVFSPFARDIVAKIAGYEYFSELEAAMKPPFGFPFTQDTKILAALEEYFGVKPVSQLVTGYGHTGFTLLVGDDLRKMERIVENELSNFPLDDLHVSLFRTSFREFPELMETARSATDMSFTDFQHKLSAPLELALVNISRGDAHELGSSNHVGTCVILSESVVEALGPQLPMVILDLASKGIHVVALSTSPETRLLTSADHVIVFGTQDGELLKAVGINLFDHRIFTEGEEGTKLRFTVVGGKGGPQMQIYPWIVNVEKPRRSLLKGIFNALSGNKAE